MALPLLVSPTYSGSGILAKSCVTCYILFIGLSQEKVQICFVSPNLLPSPKTKAGVINPGFLARGGWIVGYLGGGSFCGLHPFLRRIGSRCASQPISGIPIRFRMVSSGDVLKKLYFSYRFRIGKIFYSSLLFRSFLHRAGVSRSGWPHPEPWATVPHLQPC